MTSREIRRSFLEFFERNGHRIVSSSSLVPADDPTLLFTNAGMNQFKDVFLGTEQRPYKRAATSQKCMRVSGKHNDLDNVGPSLRHHTFFEMLGNFSFGDYFKEEAIALAWELLTKVWGLAPDRFYATVFAGEQGIPRDDEAHAIWQRFMPSSRIAGLGLSDNFWSMGDTGPCGRCSEVHYFLGADLPCSAPVCQGVACDCDRFIEVWNNVFMEFDRQPDGSLIPLPAPSIDTGMGLERISAVIQGHLSNYDTDLFTPILAAVGQRAGRRYGQDEAADVSMRVVADHLRATAFLIGDGVVPSNEWRGYVLRKIMRRAMRHGKRLGLTEPFLHGLVDVLVEHMGGQYPELGRERDTIVRIVRGEEERFDAVLTSGLGRLEEALDRAAAGGGVVPGEDLFRLYDSLGLPVDFIEDLADERRLTVDRAGFERAMAAQRERGWADADRTFESKRSADFEYATDEQRHTLRSQPDTFEGYTATRVADASVVALFDRDRRQVDELREGAGYLVLDRTPFYVESGGQVSDTGRVVRMDGGAEAVVEGMTRLGQGGPRAHRVRIVSGAFRAHDRVAAEVDADVRDATRRNHTATHLLHAALRQVLGTHVRQAGSLVAPDRLRFDFLHAAPLTEDQIVEIERLVNDRIYRNLAVETEVRSTEEAIAAGAMALFNEKYGDRVRVVSIPGFSVELCGGTHCRATGDIGFFTITGEEGVAAGVRRIEALTGAGAIEAHQRSRGVLDRVTRVLNTSPDAAPEAVAKLQSEIKRLTREVAALKMRAVMPPAAAAAEEVVDVAGVRLVARRVSGLDKAGLRSLADAYRSRLKSVVVVLASETDGKVTVVTAVTPDLIERVDAGRLIRDLAPIVGGRGGGRSDFAEAGGRDPDRIDDLLAESRTFVEKMLETVR